jgi:DNA-directed RNA polymerase alpha subunit
MRVYLKRKVSEVIAGGDVLKVKLEKTANGEKFYVDCNFDESEKLQSMGMVDAEPTPEILKVPAPKKSAPAEKAKKETTESTVTPIKDLDLPTNVYASLRRKFKTVESLEGKTVEDLTGLKGIGKKMAQTILERVAEFE